MIGSNVNFASRLEDKAETNQIIVSKEVLDVIKDEYDFERLDHNIKSYGFIEVFNIRSKVNNNI